MQRSELPMKFLVTLWYAGDKGPFLTERAAENYLGGRSNIRRYQTILNGSPCLIEANFKEAHTFLKTCKDVLKNNKVDVPKRGG
jgi:hypothetical protein